MPEPAKHLSHRSVARIPVLAAVAAALVVGGLIDRSGAPPKAAAASQIPPVPVVAPTSALSSSWFCSGATDSPGGPANSQLVIVNSGSQPAAGTVTFVPSSAGDVEVPVTVGPASRLTVPERVAHGASWIGSIVDMDAGAVAVEQQVLSPLGWSSSPCATAGSSQWYFATGATLVNARVVLTILNPYPADSVVDLTFSTNEGVEQPQADQGLVVPAGGLLVVNLGDHLRRRQFIATTVTARSGRVVAWKTDIVTPPKPGAVILGTSAAQAPLADPASPNPGVTVTLGSPSPSTQWVWPDGIAGNGMAEGYTVYNPGSATAQVELSVALDQGVAEPFDLTVGAGQVTTVVSEQEARIPPGVGHSAVLTSTNGVPVVAVRTLVASSPAPWAGLGEMAGEQVDSDGWLVPTAAVPGHAAAIVVDNPGTAERDVTVEGLGPGAAKRVASTSVGPGRRWTMGISGGVDEPLVVDANGPVYVEVNVYGPNDDPGVGLAPGVPITP